MGNAEVSTLREGSIVEASDMSMVSARDRPTESMTAAEGDHPGMVEKT